MSGHRPADQVDVGFLAGLQHAELGVDGGQLGDQPVRVRLRARAAPGVVPGRPAVAGVRVGLVVGVGGADLVGRPFRNVGSSSSKRRRLAVSAFRRSNAEEGWW